MSIRLQTAFPGAALAKNTPYMDQILSSDGLVTYFQSDPAEFTLAGSGRVASWASKSAGSDILLTGEEALRPSVSASVFGGMYEGVTFDGSDLLAWDGNFNRSLAFSWMMIFKGAVPAADGYLASTFASVGVGTWFRLTSAGQIQFSHGTGVIGTKHYGDATTIVIGSSIGESIRGRANGVDMGVAATNNAGGSDGLKIGAANYTGGSLLAPGAFHLADFAIWQRDILLDGNLVGLLEGFARDVYNVNI